MSTNKTPWTEVLKQWEPSAGSEAATAPTMEQQLAPAREQRLATASNLLMSLNVVEARLLYDELKKVFN
jgi:DNA gyrase inhibitor GyrI